MAPPLPAKAKDPSRNCGLHKSSAATTSRYVIPRIAAVRVGASDRAAEVHQWVKSLRALVGAHSVYK